MKQTGSKPPGFTLWERGSVSVYLRSGNARWLKETGIASPETLTSRGDFTRGRGVVLTHQDRKLFVKQYFRGGLLGKVLGDAYFSARRFKKELSAYDALSRAGVRVPRVLALSLKRQRFTYKAWLVSAFEEGFSPLREFFKGASSRSRRFISRKLGEVLKLAHKAGVVHPDLTVDNLCVGPEGEILVVDLDRCSFTRSPVRRWLSLFRLHRSAVKNATWTEKGNRTQGELRLAKESQVSERLEVASFLLGYLARHRKHSEPTGSTTEAKRAARPRPGTFLKAAFFSYRLIERLHAVFWKSDEKA